MQVANKTVVVTGGTDGIGLHVARQLRERGANVYRGLRRGDMRPAGLHVAMAPRGRLPGLTSSGQIP